MTILHGIFVGVQIITALALILLVMLQTTKSEGLSGTIGGKTSSTFRGKPGMDEKLADLTKWSAAGFMVASILVYVLGSRPGV